MGRHKVIILAALVAFQLAIAGCDKSDDKSTSQTGQAPADNKSVIDDLASPALKAIVGRWQLDRRASVAANMATPKLPGGLAYEFRADGTGIRRLGINPPDPISWKVVTSAGDSARLSVTEDRPSGTPTFMDVTVAGKDQLRITDVLGSSILERTTADIMVPQAPFAPDISAMVPVGTIDMAPGAGITLAASHDGMSLISRIGMASRRNFVMWDTATKKPIFTVDLAGGIKLPVALSGDGKVCATADTNGPTLRNALNGELIRSFAPRPGQGGMPVGLILSPDASLIVMAAGKNVIGWDTASGDERFTIKADPIEVSALAMFPNAKRIATGGNDGLVKIWDIPDGTFVKQLDPGEANRSTAIAISENGQRLASAHLLGKIAVFDMSGGILLRSIDPHHPRIDHLLFMPDSRSLIHPVHSSTWDLAITDTETGDLREVLKGHVGSIGSMALSSDGNTLYSAGDDECIKVWDLKTLNR